MTDTIVKDLRSMARISFCIGTLSEAADEIVRLRNALEKVRKIARTTGALDSRYAAIAENALGIKETTP